MSKSDKLNQLFEKWQKVNPAYEENFRYDGIINEDCYEKAKHKILFICKEPNGKNHEGHIGDFRKEWNEEGAQYPFSYRIAEWSYGILNNFPYLDNIYNSENWEIPYKNALRSIAFMNLKKSAGKGTSEYSTMIKVLENREEKKYILDEIKIIDPEIIILGLTWKELSIELINDIEWTNSGYQILIGKWGKRKVINFYHPSSRNAPSAAYSLLQNIVRSKEFINL